MDMKSSLSYSVGALGVISVAIASGQPVSADAAILTFDPQDSALRRSEIANASMSKIDESAEEDKLYSTAQELDPRLEKEDGTVHGSNSPGEALRNRERSPIPERQPSFISQIPAAPAPMPEFTESVPQNDIGIIDLQVPEPAQHLTLETGTFEPLWTNNVSNQPFPAQLSSEQISTIGFEGESESLVAVAIGHAEGTRTPEGDRTPAYYGHADPGNGRWNLGSFSYQHCPEHTPPCTTPAAADRHQIQRLRHQSFLIQQQAHTLGLDLSAEELLNGLDLANQAPAAALDRGYLHWLKEARQAGMTGQEAILWARVRSFLDPDTQRWNAPGLGNNIDYITADQSRRMEAIARVMETHGLSLVAGTSDEDLP